MRNHTVTLFIAFLLFSLSGHAGQETLFPRPPQLRPAIAFWTRVFTEIDTHSGFIHDDRYLNVLYDTLRLKPSMSPQQQDRAIDKAIQRYQGALLNLAKGKRKHLTHEERQALAAWGKKASGSTLKAAAQRLRFQRGQADRFRKGVIRGGIWEDYIRNTLRDLGLPEGLAALPHVESSFNPYVWSHAGAVGLWQFTRSTGKRFMRIDRVLDERFDPYKSTEAAARLLQHNYSLIKSWPLAITAYNHGISGMRRAAREMGTKDIGVIVSRYNGHRFRFASRNFYAAFLAALDVSSHAQRYFGKLERDRPDDYPVFDIPAFLPANALAEGLGVDLETLKQLNPALQASVWNGNKYVPKGYKLHLPPKLRVNDTPELLQRVAIAQGFTAQKPDRYYKVHRGDTLSGIAIRYKTSVRDLMAMNDLRSRHRIRAGQVLHLPSKHDAEPVRLASIQPLLTVTSLSEVSPTSVFAEIEAEEMGPDSPLLIVASPHEVSPTSVFAEIEAAETEPDSPLLIVASPHEVSPTSVFAEIEAAETELNPPLIVTSPHEVPPALASEEIEPAETESSETDAVLPVETQPELAADPADYEVAEDHTIEVQAVETLGHYAVWLNIHSNRLRRLNSLRQGQFITIGRRIKLDLSQVTPKAFEQRRLDYHRKVQSAYFERHQITETIEHRIRAGDSLWTLAIQEYHIPLWLLRQYNPDIDFDTVLPPGQTILVPRVKRNDGTARSKSTQVARSLKSLPLAASLKDIYSLSPQRNEKNRTYF